MNKPQSPIEVVSFDLWGTLISGDGSGRTRADILYETLQPDMDMDSFKAEVKAVDRVLDNECEATGVNLDYHVRINALCDRLAMPPQSEAETRKIYDARIEALQFHSVRLRQPDIPDVLDRIHGLGKAVALISNTGFINGAEMRGVLDSVGILDRFDHQIFSDEIGYSKPDGRIFSALASISGVPARYTAHIGDNYRADYEGGTAAGMHAVHLPAEMLIADATEQALYGPGAFKS